MSHAEETVPHRPPIGATDTSNADQTRGRTLAYHRQTEHALERYAAGPETLDWDAQPAPFRRYEGAPVFVLPRVVEVDPAVFPGPTLPIERLGEVAPAGFSAPAFGVLLGLALGITAWKSNGPDRWAVRANPSSGNLHPVEAYLLMQGVAGFASGVYHYCPDAHTLEQRAVWEPSPELERPRLWVALSSVMWREAWKYGVRAFRYCQLDVGHAVAALGHASAALGWRIRHETQVGSETLAHALGLTRLTDFRGGRRTDTELEEAEVLMEIEPIDGRLPLPAAALRELTTKATFSGAATTIDARPMYSWPSIEEVAKATRAPDRETIGSVESRRYLPLRKSGGVASTQQLVFGRRSAQRFDRHATLEQAALSRILLGVSPDAVSGPWLGTERPAVDLVLFVHRVEGLASGIYVFPRTAGSKNSLQSWFAETSQPTPPRLLDGGVQLLELTPVAPQALARLARATHCHQDIAATCCVAVGMFVHLTEALDPHAAGYRGVHREAGAIGHELYLAAELEGMRGTGIGCFFDDAVRSLVGLEASPFVPIYHFTIGKPVTDARIDSSTHDTQLEQRTNPSMTTVDQQLQSFLTNWGYDAAELDGRAGHGLTPLMRAALLGEFELVQELLSRGANPHLCNDDGNNAAWLACVANRFDIVERLRRAGVDLDHQNEAGGTVLMYAASSGKAELVSQLLALGVNPKLTNVDGASAGDMAATLECLRLLRHTIT